MSGPDAGSLLAVCPVSVIVPVHDVERYLAATLASVERQHPRPIELIVVDDGSSDRSADVASAVPSALVLRQENRGPSAARNRGAAAATQELLLFLDGDDRLLDGALDHLLSALERHPGAACVIPNFRSSDGRTGWSPDSGEHVLARDDVPALLRSHWLWANSIVRRDVWERNRFDETLRTAEDNDLWLRLLLDGHHIVVVDVPLVERTLRQGAATQDTVRMRRGRRDLYVRMWKRGDLRLGERALTVRGLIRATVGVIAARLRERWRSGPGAGTVHQVWLDAPGGGGIHARLLEEGMGEHSGLIRQRPIDAQDARRPSGSARGTWRLLRSVPRGAIVHAHGVRAAVVALPAVKFRGARMVVTVHGLHVARRDAIAVTRWMARRALRAADRVLVLSASDQRAVIDGGYAPADRVTRIHAAIATPHLDGIGRTAVRERLELADKDMLVTWVGRLEPEKDPMTAVRAAALLDGSSRTTLAIAGDGSLRSDVDRVFAAGPSGAQLRLLGWTDDIGSLLAASDVFVSTSRWEGLPMAPLEAAAARVPLILTDVPGNRDVVGAGVPAVLVPAGDPAALARAIEDLAGDPARRTWMGEHGAEVVRSTFTPALLAEDVLAVYRSLGVPSTVGVSV